MSVNGNTAALAASEIAALQQASGIPVEVNLFHRTARRLDLVARLLGSHGVKVLSGEAERLLPLEHGRGLCLREGIGMADLVLVPLEDGDRCQALRAAGKDVIAIDLNPLSRTARSATLTIVDEVTRAIPRMTAAFGGLTRDRARELREALNNDYFLQAAMDEMTKVLSHALDRKIPPSVP
jgi:4-phosphopantoate--beta-alanine ligase